MSFDRGSRTYHLSDERLRAFGALPVEARLRWAEEIGRFLCLARQSREREASPAVLSNAGDAANTCGASDE